MDMKRRIVGVIAVIALSAAAWLAAPARGACVPATCVITGLIQGTNIVPAGVDVANLGGLFTAVSNYQEAGFAQYEFVATISFAPNATTGSGSGTIFGPDGAINLGFSAVRPSANPTFKAILPWAVTIISGGTGVGTYQPRLGQFAAAEVTVGG